MIKEIESAIYDITCDIYEATDAEYYDLELKTNGFIYIVNFFLGIMIWDSDSDERLGDDEGNKIETYVEHFRRRIQEELIKLVKLKSMWELKIQVRN